MEQVTLQNIELMRMARSNGNAVTADSSGGSGGFMQIIDAMLGNIIDGENAGQLTDLLTADKSEENDGENDASVFSMLGELLQSGNGNISQDILQLLQTTVGVDGIDEIEIPNMIAKLQENNFFEAMGMDEEASDTLYALGNNTYNYFADQFGVVKNYINSVTETTENSVTVGTENSVTVGTEKNVTATGVNNADAENVIPVTTETASTTANVSAAEEASQPVQNGTIADIASLPETDAELLTGTLQERNTAKATNSLKSDLVNTEIPVTSVSYEKTADVSTIQPVVGIMVPNMVSQRVVKADVNSLEQLANEGNADSNPENESFDSQLSEMATTNANINIQPTNIELPKVQNLSNPLFNEFHLSEQITDGVKANLNLEKTEFTVKLNPESLGELTLKIVEESGKMVLDITAASENTAKLLNSDLAVLRESVGSMNLEIREVTVSAPENIEENNAQFDMTGQQFSEQQRAFANHQQQQSNKPYYAAQHGSYGVEEVVADYTGRVAAAVDGLDTYV